MYEDENKAASSKVSEKGFVQAGRTGLAYYRCEGSSDAIRNNNPHKLFKGRLEVFHEDATRLIARLEFNANSTVIHFTQPDKRIVIPAPVDKTKDVAFLNTSHFPERIVPLLASIIGTHANEPDKAVEAITKEAALLIKYGQALRVDNNLRIDTIEAAGYRSPN